MSKTIFSLMAVLLLTGVQLFGQNPSGDVVRCYTMEADAALRAQHPEMGTLQDFENWLAPLVKEYKANPQNQNRAVVTLPIIFHVIHNGTSVGSGDNISTALVNAQIDQLNNDFRRILGTSGYNTDSRGADTEIEFCPATVSPTGATLSTPGINRINRSSAGFSTPPYSQGYMDGTIKPATVWNPDDYINIWVANLSGGLLGYAQFPSSSGLSGLNSNGGAANTDGVVVLTSSVGSSANPNPSGGVYDEGRTLTHELGHFFGLRHIWGDANCGNDYCGDTPAASGPASGCPNKTTCDGVRDMVENYMDYSYDNCMNIFTNDQNARIQTVMANSPRRGSLVNSGACGGSTGGGFTCGTTVTSFPYSEGFEGGFGAWTQASGDDFNWSRNSGSTPSSNTGPSAAAAGSWYVYTEASSPNFSNKTASLESPCFDLSGKTTAAISFQYHNYGAAEMGDLFLEATTDGNSWNTIWSRVGNQGNSWQAGSASLSSYAGSTVKLRFRGVTGTTWQGDMAVDDVSVTASSGGTGGGSCTANVSLPYSEGFESGFGAWSQASGDDFNWSRNSGGTPSSNTGPASANGGSWYLYTESSSPNYSNKTSILNGPCFDLTSTPTATFSFSYHMYGAAAMGALYLEASTNNGSSWSAVWSETGNQGNAWQTANVNMSAYVGGTVQLRFRGVTGTTWQGDMAVDDVSMSAGGGSGGCTDVDITITFDDYPEETSWQILDGSTIVASGGTYGSQADGSTINLSECLDAGCYDFVISDVYGDGICCTYGNGSYLVSSGGVTLASGGAFTSSETTNFCVGGARVNPVRSVYRGEGLTLFPNPTSNQLNVRFENGAEGPATVWVMDVTGRRVAETQWNLFKGINEHAVNVSQVPAGTYTLMIIQGEKVSTQRFVVAK